MEEMSLGGAIANIVDYKMRDKYTALPAVVLSVHRNGETTLLDVQPLISIRERDGDIVEQATVLNVPYALPASSTGGMVFPVNVGDNVMLVYSMRGMDTWKYGNGSPTPASDNRMFSKVDCVAIPCITPTNKANTPANKHTADYAAGDVALYHGMGGSMCEIILKKDGRVFINSPSKVTVNCSVSEVNASESVTYNTQTFKINCTNYQVSSTSYQIGTASYSLAATGGATTTGTMNMSGSFVLNGITLESHTHSGTQPGNGSTGAPQ